MMKLYNHFHLCSVKSKTKTWIQTFTSCQFYLLLFVLHLQFISSMENKFILIDNDAQLPTRSSIGSVGYDLYCPINIILPKFQVVKIPLGLKLEMNHNYWAQILSRSSMGMNGISIMGGVVDPDFKGEICVLLYNHMDDDYQIKKGHKIAQLVFHKSEFPINVSNHDIRGEFGFGSSGK